MVIIKGKRLFNLAYKGLLLEKGKLEYLKQCYPHESLYDKKLREIQLEMDEIIEKINTM